jgi:SP family general alpha glucoside:H+ symporter-like MFS transporter
MASATHHEDEHGIAVAATHLEGDVVGIDDEVLLKMSKNIDNFGEITENAQAATSFEHEMTFSDALKLYPKAIGFSVILSLAIVMEGYDTALLGSFYGYPVFQERFGVRLGDGSFQVTSSWQYGLQNGAQVGEILGLMIAGILADRYGYKKTMLGALLMITGAIFLLFFAQNIGMLMAGEILCGIPWGAFQTLTTTYAAEVSPVVLRPYLTTYVNMCVSKYSPVIVLIVSIDANLM